MNETREADLRELRRYGRREYMLIAVGVVLLLVVVANLALSSPKGPFPSGAESLRIVATCSGCDSSTSYGQQFSGRIFNSTGGKSSSYTVGGNDSRAWLVLREPVGGGWYVAWSFGSYSLGGTLTVSVQLSNGTVVYDSSAPGFASSLYGIYQERNSTAK